MNTQAKPRRTKINSVAGALATAQKVQQSLPEPTRELAPAAMQHFERLIASRESDSWSTADLAQATQLAQLNHLIDEALSVIERDGRTVLNDKGGMSQHPEVKNVAQFSSAARALSTALGLSAAQRGLTGPEQALRNKTEAQARSAINNRDRFSLLA